jgi:hypothetical protein
MKRFSVFCTPDNFVSMELTAAGGNKICFYVSSPAVTSSAAAGCASIGLKLAAVKTRDRFYETPFPPKSFGIIFYLILSYIYVKLNP